MTISQKEGSSKHKAELPFKVLFVCMGNICRSPAGENVMNHFLKKADIDHLISCDSAGTISHHAGEAPDPRMSATAAKRGFTFKGRARAFLSEDFDHFDLIIPMDKDNRDDLLKLSKNKEQREKVTPFCEYLRHHDDEQVPDPYYGRIDGFEHVMDLMEDGCEHLIEQLQQRLNQST